MNEVLYGRQVLKNLPFSFVLIHTTTLFHSVYCVYTLYIHDFCLLRETFEITRCLISRPAHMQITIKK